jgi:hypothetical protein
MAFHGYGKQAEAEQKSGGRKGPSGEAPRGFIYFEKLKDKRNFLTMVFMSREVKDREYIVLDDIKNKDSPQFGVLVHQFWYGGKGDNVVTSLEGVDERGCPFSQALRERLKAGGDFLPRFASSVWLLSVIEMDEFTYEKGPNAGKTVYSRRRLLPVPRGRTANSKVSRVEEFMNFATKLKGGLRLQRFQVSRTAGQTAAKIGTTWWPTQEAITPDLKAKLTKDAEFYGFASLEDYLKPVDYKTVCQPYTYEEATRLAKFVEADRLANPGKFSDLNDEGGAEVGEKVEHGDAYEGPDPKPEEGETLPF